MKKENKRKAPPGAHVGDQVKPNVFFIMIDDMGWADMGYHNSGIHGVTPNLDKLAAGGIKVTIGVRGVACYGLPDPCLFCYCLVPIIQYRIPGILLFQ